MATYYRGKTRSLCGIHVIGMSSSAQILIAEESAQQGGAGIEKKDPGSIFLLRRIK
jgi:hypothetical protein